MASKVMVKMPVLQFNQVKKGNVSGDLVTLARQSEINPRNVDRRGSDATRVAQLEQNIRFLQEQHQLMLGGLHKEIDNLKHRNRELQFQLVFTKGSVPSSPSSSEDDSKHKLYTSPTVLNITPLQVEILEKELGELKIQVQDMENQNAYLSAIVDEQKKKLEKYEYDREREREKSAEPNADLLRKLDDTEALVRKLHQENSDLKRDNASGGSPPSFAHRDSYYSRDGRGNQAKGSGRYRGNNYKGNWFPPLHTQSYWQGGKSTDKGSPGTSGETSLPNLHGGNPGQSNGRRNSNNNHHYRSNGDGRKYRGGQNKGHKPS